MRTLVIFIAFIYALDGFAQKDIGVIWMGFEHAWTYNHRLNRLGDYIEQPQFDGFDYPVKHIHTGATGVGWDEALFTSYYTAVTSEHIGFQSGFVELDLINREGDQAIVKKTVEISLEDNLEDKDQIVALLNGFDLVANTRADKLKMLSITLSEPIYNATKSKVIFNVEVGFSANCGSLECNRFIQKYDYTIKVQYLLMAGNDKYFNTKEKSFIKSYEWDKKDIFEDGIINESVQGKPNYGQGTLGFKSIVINMDRDHWVVDWNTAIHPQFYNAKTGKMDFAMDLLLKQWKKKIDSPFKFQSKFSKRKDGWAYVNGSVVLLQFNDACKESLSRSGALTWKGMNKEAETNEAINVHRFKVKDGCR
jgi:hypothetical protein